MQNRKNRRATRATGARPRQKPGVAPPMGPPPDKINGLVALYKQGRLEELLKRGKVLSRKYPNAIIVHNLLGAANAGLGRLPEAIAVYTRALEISPDSAEVYNNLGLALKSAAKYDEAIANFAKALRIKPDSVEVHINLCTIYDELNRGADLVSALQAAWNNGLEENPYIILLLAKSTNRNKDYEQTLSYLEKIDLEGLPTKDQRAYFNIFGTYYDGLGLFDKAFAQFEKQNEIARAMLPDKLDPQGHLDGIVRLATSWKSGAVSDWSATAEAEAAEDTSLAFLVGFPRSGTTLLDTVLLGHPQITVFEERPMVARMRDEFGRTPLLEDLNNLTSPQIRGLRGAYLDELQRHGGKLELDTLFVDKHPMNIRSVGFIHRVFPKAKFVLALRHPCDCVLSCFMQNFMLNDATANFLSLAQSAKLYAAAMELWSTYTASLNLDTFLVKYEDLVEDLRGTAGPLIEFLGLRWDDKALEFQETAKNRGIIPTPSYAELAKPLYGQARGRWKNYSEQMKPVLPLLQAWIDEFGYRDERM